MSWRHTCRGLTGRMEGPRTAATVVWGWWWSEGGCCQGSPVRANDPCCCTCCTCCTCCRCCWLLLRSTTGVTRGSVESTEEIFRTVCENSYWLRGPSPWPELFFSTHIAEYRFNIIKKELRRVNGWINEWASKWEWVKIIEWVKKGERVY